MEHFPEELTEEELPDGTDWFLENVPSVEIAAYLPPIPSPASRSLLELLLTFYALFLTASPSLWES
jgi:hypothetical protein